MKKRIGVLALQGAFHEHRAALSRLGAESFEIRSKADLTPNMAGLILPGGESTVMGKLLHELELFFPIKSMIDEGLPVFGTCAGLILLSKRISNEDHTYFDAMDITTKRNAYGRQLGSFKTNAPFKGIGQVPMVFIRAPLIESVSEQVEVLSQTEGAITAARQENMLVTAFHPELTPDLRVHEYFLSMTQGT